MTAPPDVPAPADLAEFRRQLRIHGIERAEPEAASALAQTVGQ